MPKSQALIPYDPKDVEFWKQQYILSNMVNLLKLRGGDVDSGADLRLIMTVDDGEATLFLTGEEVVLIQDILTHYSDTLSLFPDESRSTDLAIADRILDRLDYETNTSE